MKRLHNLAPGLLLLCACFSYGPPATPSPRPGTRVSIRLWPDATDSLAAALGPDVGVVEGVVVTDDSVGLALSMRRTETRRGVTSRWSGERFTFPHDSYIALAERRLSLPGSLLVGGVVVGRVVGLYSAFGNGASQAPGGGATSGAQ
jgi:hypothetical protein